VRRSRRTVGASFHARSCFRDNHLAYDFRGGYLGIALKLRQPGRERVYLYPQIFTGLTYLIASFFMLALWLVQRKKAVNMR
jgi:hypothetical protein